MDKITDMFNIFKSAKAYVGTLAAVGGLMVTLGADNDFQTLVPETAVGKVAAIGTALVAFTAIFAPRNARSVEQAQQDLEVAKNRAAKPKRRRRKPAVQAVAKSDTPVVPVDPAPPADH